MKEHLLVLIVFYTQICYKVRKSIVLFPHMIYVDILDVTARTEAPYQLGFNLFAERKLFLLLTNPF